MASTEHRIVAALRKRFGTADKAAVAVLQALDAALAQDDELDDYQQEQAERHQAALVAKILDRCVGLDGEARSDVEEMLRALTAGVPAADERGSFEDSPHYRVGFELFRRGLRGDAYQAALTDALEKLGASDEPPPFSGRPRPGGSMDPITSATDAASEKSFAERFPHASAVTVDRYGGEQLARPPVRQSAQEAADYERRFPGTSSSVKVH